MTLYGRRGIMEVWFESFSLISHSLLPLYLSQDRNSASYFLIFSTFIACICYLITIGAKLTGSGANRRFLLEEIVRHSAYTILFVVTPIAGWERLFFPEAGDETGFYNWLGALGLTLFGGGVIMLFHLPERWWPGKFDLFFRSHTLMHVIMSAVAYYQYQTISRDIDTHYENVSESDAEHFAWLGSNLLRFAFAFMILSNFVSNRKFLLGGVARLFSSVPQPHGHSHAHTD